MDLGEIFGAGGRLAEAILDYQSRPSQQEMAEMVAAALATKEVALLEAGTGTGKTFAYLAPLLLSNARAVVSTSTRSLQEQLVRKDLPTLCRALKVKAEIRLLKGRANYLCLQRMDKAQRNPELPLQDNATRPDLIARDLDRVVAFARNTKDGDLADLKGVPRYSRVWPLVTSTVDNCTVKECPDYDRCYVYRAREYARQAQILVVNHALLLADAKLRAASLGDIIPPYENLVCDEAHELPELILRTFANRLNTEDLAQRVRDLAKEVSAEEKYKDWEDALDSIVARAEAAHQACPKHWRGSSISNLEAVGEEIWAQELLSLEDALASAFAVGESLAADEEISIPELSWLASAQELCTNFRTSDSKVSGWLELTGRSLSLYQVPADWGSIFAQQVVAERTAIFTSATLDCGDDFAMFSHQIGVAEVTRKSWPSPFDYPSISRLLLPAHAPDPRSDRIRHEQYVCAIIARLAPRNHGGTLALFTTKAEVKRAGLQLRRQLKTNCAVLIQGEDSQEELLAKFRKKTKLSKLLIGTRTFWQGIDLPGEVLTLVVIDRIPFQRPDDPFTELAAAQLAEPSMKFSKLQVPKAAMVLRQGAGRLIRHGSDYGVLVLCDPRLNNSSFGERILSCLPPMSRTFDPDEVVRFLRERRL